MKIEAKQAAQADANKTAAGGNKPSKEALEVVKEFVEIEEKERNAMHFRRGIVFWLLLFPSAFIPTVFLIQLGFAVYGRCPLPGLDANGEFAWPPIAFVSGTFLSFIAVFGVLSVGVFSSSRDKSHDFFLPTARDLLNRVSDGGN